MSFSEEDRDLRPRSRSVAGVVELRAAAPQPFSRRSPITLSAGLVFRSEAGHSLELFGIPIPLYRDRCNGTFDLPQIVGRESDGKCADILIEALKLAGARDGNDPRLLGEQPSECDPSWSYSLLFSVPG